MKLFKIVNGYLQENAYIIGDDYGCYIIDPGQFSQLIINKIEKEFNKVCGILLTHGHFDHCQCVDELVNRYKCDVYMGKEDIIQIDGSLIGHFKLQNMVAKLETVTKDPILLKDKNIISIYTPGHTEGSYCYLFKKEKILFSGDTLFFEAIGRTDLPGGNKNSLIQSLKELVNLDDDITVYPGHDQMTTIRHEKQYNPFI